MYESHFGISGPPFQLNPDPGFYYDSRGHQGVLAELNRGLDAGQGIVVLSGEVGAGKTTLVRSILAVLEDDTNVAVAQILSSQLDASDLVDAALIAFGAPRSTAAEASPAARLLAHLDTVAKAGQRALLLIDEAQNLPRSSFELLHEVFGGDSGVPPVGLQTWLIGQPELRQMLEGTDLVKLKRHVAVSCHLGPIGVGETGPYIEHRLRRVGWTGTPAFATGAFEAIFRWTDGVPRRINMLCNRLMLSSFLSQATTVSAEMVAATARDLLAEIGEPAKLSVLTPAVVEAAAAPTPAPAATDDELIVLRPVEVAPPAPLAKRPAPPAEVPLPDIVIPPEPAPRAPVPVSAPVPAPAARPVPVVDLVLDGPATRPPVAAPTRSGLAPLLIVVAGYGDHVKAAALWRAIVDRSGTSAVKLVRAFPNTAFRLNRGLFTDLDAKTSLIELDIADRAPSLQAAEITQRFGEVMRRDPPRAVVVFDGSDAALACALAAQSMGVPVAHVNAGLRLREQPTARDLTGKLVDEAAEILYTPEMAHLEQLAQDGVSRGRLACVGNLLVDSLQATLPSLGEAPGQRARLVVPAPYLAGRNGFALVMMTQPVDVGDRASLKHTVEVVGSAARDLPLLWVMHDPVRDLFIKSRFDRGLSADRITVIAMQPFSVYVDILRSATCVITDSWNVQEEAAALGIPCVVAGMRGTRPAAIGQRFGHAVGMSKAAVTRAVWDCIFTGGRRPVVPPQWDGQTGARLVDHLMARVSAAPMRATA